MHQRLVFCRKLSDKGILVFDVVLGETPDETGDYDLHVYDGATGEEQWTASDAYGYTPLLDNANGVAKCDGGYHECTDFGPPAGYAPPPRNEQKPPAPAVTGAAA